MNKFFHWLDKVSSGINKVFIFIASSMMAGLMIIVCVDLTLRYVFNSLVDLGHGGDRDQD